MLEPGKYTAKTWTYGIRHYMANRLPKVGCTAYITMALKGLIITNEVSHNAPFYDIQNNDFGVFAAPSLFQRPLESS
jgi:hypothetical protein